MSKRNGDRARFQLQRQARMLRRKRAAELMKKLKAARPAATTPVEIKPEAAEA